MITHAPSASVPARGLPYRPVSESPPSSRGRDGRTPRDAARERLQEHDARVRLYPPPRVVEGRR